MSEQAESPPGVFPYFDGAATVYADPLAIHRQLTRALDGNPNRVLVDVAIGKAEEREAYLDEESWELAVAQEEATEELRYAATEKLLAAIRQVFQMAPFDRATGQGATEKHCRDALAAFCDYMEEAKKKA